MSDAKATHEESAHSNTTSSDLLDAGRRKDDDAWKLLVKRYSRLIRHWCRNAGVCEQEIDDLEQVVMAQVATGLDRFRRDGRPASFRRWLRTITERKIVDHRRRTFGELNAMGGTDNLDLLGQIPVADNELSDSSSPAVDDRRERLWDCFQSVENEVGQNTWDAFWLTTAEGLTSSEAGEILGISPNAVRLGRARVLKRLRRQNLFPSRGMTRPGDD